MSDPAPAIQDLLRQRAWLERFAATLVVDAVEADDLAQETLLAALERPPERVRRPRAWLGTVASHLLQRLRVRDRRRAERERSAAAPEALPPMDEVVARANLHRTVVDAVLAIAEPYRTTVLLRFFEDLPPRAISQRTKSPVDTVNTRIKRGVELVRAELVRRRGDAAKSGEWAVALVGLLTPWGRRAVRHALVTNAAGVGGAIGGVGVVSLLGVLGMSTKIKVVAALVVVAIGTFAVARLVESPNAPPETQAASATRRTPSLPAPAAADAMPLPAPAGATRAAEQVDVAKPATGVKQVPADGAIEGIVRTALGAPAAGALVLLEAANRSARFGSISDLCAGAEELLEPAVADEEGERGASRVLAGGDGRFRFAASPIGGSVNVAAIHRDEGVALATGLVVDGSSANRSVELVLTAGVVLHGSVTGEQGEPIADASIAVMQFQRTAESSSSSSLLSVTADSQGRYRTLPLPFDGFRLTAVAAGCFHGSQEAFPIAPGERERRVDFQLERAPTWRGRVLTNDGAPAHLAGMVGRLVVVASSVGPDEEHDTPERLGDLGQLDGAGDRYEVTPGQPNRRFISIWGDGVLLGIAEIVQSDVAPDVVVDLAKIPRPKATGTLVLQVVDGRTDSPIRSYHVDLAGDPLTFEEPDAREESRQVDDPDGRFAIEALLAGNYDVSIRAEHFAPLFASVRVAGSSPTSPNDPATPVRLALRHADACIDGRVEDDGGQPVDSAQVFLLNVDGTVALPSPEYRCVSDEDGRFAFQGIGEGDYLVVASCDRTDRLILQSAGEGDSRAGTPYDEFAPASAPARARSPESADREPVVVKLRRGFDVEVDPRFDGTTVTGPFSFRIRDERGAAVHDHHRPSSITQMSGSNFRFRLVPGSYSIEVFSPKFAPNRTAFRAAPDTKVVVELERTTTAPPSR